MAEDDNDESFGDFTFASFPSNPTLHPNPNPTPNQMNGPKSITNNDYDDEEDEWGDFLEYPLGVGSTSPSQPQSKPTRSQIQWVKPIGALPLSIFGDLEEEEEEEKQQSGGFDSQAGNDEDSYKSFVGNVRNGLNVNTIGKFDDFIGNLYNHNNQIKDQNGSGLNSRGSNVNSNEVHSNTNGSVLNSDDVVGGDHDVMENLFNNVQKMKNENGFNLNSNGLNSNFNAISSNHSGLDSNSIVQSFDLGGLNLDFNGFNSTSATQSLDLGGLNLDFNGLQSNSNRLDSTMNVSSSEISGLGLNSDLGGGNEEFDADGDGWEFKSAYSESKDGDENDKEEPKVNGLSHSVGRVLKFDGQNQADNNSNGSVDLFAASNGFSSNLGAMDTGFDRQSAVIQNDLYFKQAANNAENGLYFHPVVENERSEKFTAAFPETGSKEGNETRSENHKRPLLLSIFGDEEQESDDSMNIQDVFMYQSASHPRNVQSHGSNISINDLISNLYSQAEQIPSVDTTEKQIVNGLGSTERMIDSNLVDGDDDFDDGSWEFKDAFSPIIAENPTSLLSLADTHQNCSPKLRINNYVDFYCKLKEELCFVAGCHLDGLKKARSTAVPGDDGIVAALDEEIQAACEDLHHEKIISNEAASEDHSPRDNCLDEFLDILHEQKFQVLESEYNLSRRLSLAEKDLRSALDLMKHTTTILKILTLGSMEEQSNYVSTWFRIISVCAQELKHGAWIWKQSLENNAGTQILSETRGKRFILSLGEIYRTVAILGASAKLYKPWILSSSGDSTGIFALLEECHTLWSSSGLKEALLSISDPIGSIYYCTPEALVDSIECICNLDALALENHVFNKHEPKCRLSVLTQGVVSGLKFVVWNEEHYFLTLANLWANLISCCPPKLPQINIG